MSVIIRLQNLPWTANALDIRRFFSGLSIPDGGVHIVGGDKGDAFIAFSTDEDARRAMLMDGGRIGTNALKLYLSSKTEMQNVIAIARGAAPPSQNGSSSNVPPMSGPSAQNHQYQPQMQPPQGGQSMHGQNYGPPSGPPSYSQGNTMLPPQNMPPQGQLRGGMPMEQRVITQDVSPYNTQPQDHMMSQGRPLERPLERPMWDHGDMDPRDRGEFDRRDMLPTGYDRPREMEPQNFNARGPMDGGRIMNEPPMNDFRDSRPRDDFRGPSPRRESFSPPRDRYMDDRRENRKRRYEDNLCIFVGNMPVPLNYRDIRTFFTGMEIPRNGLKLINDRNGHRVGEAFVMFSTEDASKQALRMDGWMVKGQRVRIEPTSMDKFESAVDSYVPPGPRQQGLERPPPMNMNKRPRSRSPKKRTDSLAVVVKNLPYTATKRDLFRLFAGIRFAKGDVSVVIEHGKDGKPAGNALIELFSERDVDTATGMSRKCDVGGRVLEIINIPKQEYDSRVERSLKYAPKDESTNVKPASVPKDDKSSERKNSEVKNERHAPKEQVKSDKSESKPKDDSLKKEDRFYCVKMHGIPFDCDKAAIQDFFRNLQVAHKGIRIVFQPDGRAFHTCFVEFVSSEDCKKALAKDKEYIGTRYINISAVSKQQMMDEFYSLTDKFNERAGGRGDHPPGSTSVASQVGKPGCVISIQNLHFDATLEDILHFFRGFSPIANSVKMRYNQDGRPVGDAMVAFHNRHDANAAVAEMDRRPLMGRSVSLSIM